MSTNIYDLANQLERSIRLLPEYKAVEEAKQAIEADADAKAVFELDSSLRFLDSNDPTKYDFALFGLGVFEGF